MKYSDPKELALQGITISSDGLLRDWLARGLLKPSLLAINESINKRQREITFLCKLHQELFETLGESEKEPVNADTD
jgi:hypothetical protein